MRLITIKARATVDADPPVSVSVEADFSVANPFSLRAKQRYIVAQSRHLERATAETPEVEAVGESWASIQEAASELFDLSVKAVRLDGEEVEASELGYELKERIVSQLDRVVGVEGNASAASLSGTSGSPEDEAASSARGNLSAVSSSGSPPAMDAH